MRESKFQSNLVKELKLLFPGSYVLKLDPTNHRGIPDLLILFGKKWATLECKESSKASHRPGQNRNVEVMNDMSYSSFIYPENKEKVLNDLQELFRA